MISDVHLILGRLNQLLVKTVQLLLLGLDDLADLVIPLSELLQGLGHLKFLGVTALPSWHLVIWLQKGVSEHMRYFPLVLFCL